MPSNPLETAKICSGTFLAAEFFKDSPWLMVPQDRLGEILIEPLHPRGRLLGGASKQDSAPKSKLAALAAARKKKENQRAEDGQPATSSVALLDRLAAKSRDTKATAELPTTGQRPRGSVAEQADNVQKRKYPARKVSDVTPSPARLLIPPSSSESETTLGPNVEKRPEVTPAAAPSIFAQIMLGFPSNTKAPGSESSDHYILRDPEPYTEFDFAGPSPDDVVLKAQNSRAPTQKSVKPAPQLANNSKNLDEAAQGIKNITIEEPKVKRKNLDVLAEFERSKPKNAANFVVIGMIICKLCKGDSL